VSAGLDLDALDTAARASTVVRRGTVKISAHLAGTNPQLKLAETRVLQLAAQGLQDWAIARQLRCSPQAVIEIFGDIFAKLGLDDDSDLNARVAAVLWWVTR